MKASTPLTVIDSLDNIRGVIGKSATHGSAAAEVSSEERTVLRELGEKIAQIAALPIHSEKREMWSRLNDLDSAKPMVWLTNVPWGEMNVDNELTLLTVSPFCRQIEFRLRQTLYRWHHMPCDMVVEPVIHSPIAISSSGIGIQVEEDIVQANKDSSIVAHRFHNVIQNEDDIEKIQMPAISHDEKKSKETYQAYSGIFDGILTVEPLGSPRFHYSPWDELVQYTGVQNALLDLAMRPAFIHMLMDKLMSAYLHGLDQFISLNLLSLNNTNVRTGSGAYGYTTQLPQSGFDEGRVRTIDLWGGSTAQIFAEVSPAMHEEFALAYERRWLERFGLSYYGCCEPLAMKMDLLRKIPNLRKVSASPWNDIEKMAKEVAGEYVFSHKPNPAVLAPTRWDPDLARYELESMLGAAGRNGCHVEIIMKDISTVHHEPQRLWEWARIAAEVAEGYSIPV